MPKPGEVISRRQGQPSTLTITEVTKKFGGLTAVNNVSLTARQGHITALIGPNGAGKTSLFNVITGFETADRGSIKLDDVELAGLAPWQIAQRGVVRTFQTPVGFPADCSGEPPHRRLKCGLGEPASRTDRSARVGA